MDRHILHIDPAAEAEHIVNALHHYVRQVFHRCGALIGASGGRDSSPVLCHFARKRQAADFLRMGLVLLEPPPARIAVYVPHGE